jgi:hypothetical protein
MAKQNIVGQDLEDLLNRCMPVAQRAKLGSVIYDLVNTVNAQNAVIRTLVAKLNADAGVTDTNYTAASLLDVKLPEAR